MTSGGAAALKRVELRVVFGGNGFLKRHVEMAAAAGLLANEQAVQRRTRRDLAGQESPAWLGAVNGASSGLFTWADGNPCAKPEL